MTYLSTAKTNWITVEEQFDRFVSPLFNKVDEIGKFPIELSRLIAHYALDPQLSDWLTALKSIGIFPDKIPSAPNNIRELLAEPCPAEIYPKKKGWVFLYNWRKMHLHADS